MMLTTVKEYWFFDFLATFNTIISFFFSFYIPILQNVRILCQVYTLFFLAVYVFRTLHLITLRLAVRPFIYPQFNTKTPFALKIHSLRIHNNKSARHTVFRRQIRTGLGFWLQDVQSGATSRPVRNGIVRFGNIFSAQRPVDPTNFQRDLFRPVSRTSPVHVTFQKNFKNRYTCCDIRPRLIINRYLDRIVRVVPPTIFYANKHEPFSVAYTVTITSTRSNCIRFRGSGPATYIIHNVYVHKYKVPTFP